jgi:cytochrome c
MNRITLNPQQVLNLSTIAALLFPLLLSPQAIKATDVPAGDPVRGKQLFARRCTGCHSLDQDKEGPRLGKVYGSRAGAVASFKYSDALKASNIVWNDATLDKWLKDPDSLVPDNDMSFHVADSSERADIIRYLQVSSGSVSAAK